MNEITTEQVIAAFETAGFQAVAPAPLIAAVLSSQLSATSAAFSHIPFSVEPDNFAVQLREEY